MVHTILSPSQGTPTQGEWLTKRNRSNDGRVIDVVNLPPVWMRSLSSLRSDRSNSVSTYNEIQTSELTIYIQYRATKDVKSESDPDCIGKAVKNITRHSSPASCASC